ncbi:xanthine dehydrogenase accessory factor [Poseidonocella pacifica]|uniref:Xanthine dehydrogenase accessory factor n=1 Tax=Poseidonocella pacifica TaxID=871651 RepID=A0A1I0XV72_9RHOB|nr:XdhC family protein [Poseidonocella pacifica]SFB04336.1 xanthine dehydrogenase accessory factor [Poseidonocella pacifica]
MHDDDDITKTVLRMFEAGRGAALATVIETWGSAPRPVGSQLAIAGDGEMAGSVSGGCVEGAVVAEAQDAIRTGQCSILEFGVADEDAFAVGLACGGNIRILVEPVGIGYGPDPELLRSLARARTERRPIVLSTNLSDWDRTLLPPDDGKAAQGLRTDTSFVDGASFYAVHNPPLKLAVVGAVHIAQPLTRMAVLAGYDVTIIDPRESFASPARFPDLTLVHDWPDEALAAHGLDTRTAVVTLTHDPKLDNPAIETTLRSEVFYLGCLGSTRTQAKRVRHLKEAGFSDVEIARIHAPVGLDIGSRSPAEIAISIMAEMTERLRRPNTRPGRTA